MKRPDSSLFDRLMEAVWLTAIVSIPVYFNIETSRVFEPDKVHLAGSLAILTLAFWTTQLLDRLLSRRTAHEDPHWLRGTGTRRLLLVIGFFSLSTVLSTIFSVHVASSLFGSFERGQGMLAEFSFMVIGLSVGLRLRRHEQMKRIISAMIIAGTAVALYGILQHFGTDPVPWGGDAIFRISSTQGHPVFVSGFLILTIPAVLYRLIAGVGRAAGVARAAGTAGISPGTGNSIPLTVASAVLTVVFVSMAWMLSPKAGTAAMVVTLPVWYVVAPALGLERYRSVQFGLYSILLSIQLTAVLFTRSRGPLLGLLVAAGLVLFIIWSRKAARSKRLTAVISLFLIAASGLLLLQSQKFQHILEPVPYIGRFAAAFSEKGTGRSRLLIWQGIVDLMRLDKTRIWTGYGPETMKFVFPDVFPPELAHIERIGNVPDRAHNELLDRLESRGIIGVLSYLLLIAALFGVALRKTGIRLRSPPRDSFWHYLVITSLVLSVITWWLDQSLRLTGLSLSVGLILGVILFVATRKTAVDPKVMERTGYLAFAVLAAFSAFFVETQLGFGTATTYLYFWIWVGILLAMERLDDDGNRLVSEAAKQTPDAQSDGSQFDRASTDRATVAITGLLAGIVSALLTMNFIRLTGIDYTAAGITWLLLMIGCLSLGIAWEEADFGSALNATRGSIVRFVAWSVAPILGVVIVSRLRGIASSPEAKFIVVLLLLVASLIAMVLLSGNPAARPRRKLLRLNLSSAILILPSAIFLIIRFEIRPIQADISLNVARGIERVTGTSDAAINYYTRAVEYSPTVAEYYYFLGSAYFSRAIRDTTRSRYASYESALDAYRKASALNPVDFDYPMNTARLLGSLATREQDELKRQKLFGEAFDILLKIADSSPGMLNIRVEAGQMAALSGEYDTAQKLFKASINTDPDFIPAYLALGALYVSMDSLAEAEKTYQLASEMDPENMGVRLRQGGFALGMHQYDVALGYFEQVVEVLPDNPIGSEGILRSLVGRGDCSLAFSRLRTMPMYNQTEWSNRMMKWMSRACSAKSTGRVTE